MVVARRKTPRLQRRRLRMGIMGRCTTGTSGEPVSVCCRAGRSRSSGRRRETRPAAAVIAGSRLNADVMLLGSGTASLACHTESYSAAHLPWIQAVAAARGQGVRAVDQRFSRKIRDEPETAVSFHCQTSPPISYVP